METIIIILSIIQAMSISLGVGSSTMAILTFFKAIADGSIDPIERGFMGITYIVLRVAMVLILLTTAALASIGLYQMGDAYTTSFILAQLMLTTILFVNATLMTAKIMPSKFGPAIQAGSWYSLGFIMALLPLGLAGFSFPVFLVTYLVFLIFVILLIGRIMSYINAKHQVN
jgi:hypothetical protein